jgi:small subunit ribosomal protein S6
MNNSYELMYIIRTDLPEEAVQQEISKYNNLLSEHNAEDIVTKILGKRRLAYPIKKHNDGIYVQVNYKGDGKQVALIERSMRLSDEVIRYLTTKLKDSPEIVVEDESIQATSETVPPILVEAAPIEEVTPEEV